MATASTYRETCRCGAIFVATGQYTDANVQRFREAHKVCREFGRSPEPDDIGPPAPGEGDDLPTPEPGVWKETGGPC